MVLCQLCSLDHLDVSGFGRPPPRHGLQLLFWFANHCVTFDPDNAANTMLVRSKRPPKLERVLEEKAGVDVWPDSRWIWPHSWFWTVSRRKESLASTSLGTLRNFCPSSTNPRNRRAGNRSAGLPVLPLTTSDIIGTSQRADHCWIILTSCKLWDERFCRDLL